MITTLLPNPGMLILIGAYGSGKTECALALATALAPAGPVTLVDMDFVTPYFRAQEHRTELEARGVRVVAPETRAARMDAPALPVETAEVLCTPAGRTIVDMGGDPAGAVVIGQYAPRLPDYACWGVVNFARPMTETPELAAAFLTEIAGAARLHLTGLVSNTHLGALTTPDDLHAGLAAARKLGLLLALPVILQCIPAGLPAPAGPPALTITPRLRRPWE